MILTLALLTACKDGAGPQETGLDSGGSIDTDVPLAESCPVTFTATAQSAAAGMAVAGGFNAWSTEATPMVEGPDGVWSVTVNLAPGSYPYKLVEKTGADGRNEEWSCDPNASETQCDAGYDWNPSCGLGEGSCNSMITVANCDRPTLSLQSLDINRAAGAVRLTPSFSPARSGAALRSIRVELDGVEQTPLTNTDELNLSGLGEGRHTLRLTAVDEDGVGSEEVYVPFWTDDRQWATGLMYFVFVDRFEDGDASRNSTEGTNYSSTDYMGGDWQGVIDRLDYLDDLGVTALWLTAPQNNPKGAWGDKCGANFSGYHGYWPASANGLEEHFGDEALLRTLIDEAHARGMRVLVDWVANHVHDEHAYAANTDWFNSELICQGDVWNTAPEVCWFDSFLPDIRYYDEDPLVQMVNDAVAFAKDYEIDGYRVDAVKHMPHSVYFNLQSKVVAEIEHRAAGGDEEFYTVGETFSGERGLIGSYVNDQELDAQFDFSMYWAILSAFARGESSLPQLDAEREASASAYSGYLMSTFLGNHDVDRFITHAAGQVASLYGDGICGSDGRLRSPATPPGWGEPYERLMLAWTYLLTNEGLPLIYYGDEIGLEGFGDPDNRHMMRFDGELGADEQRVLSHVSALGQARRAHPALAIGQRTGWWSEDDVLGWARVYEGDEALVIVNRSGGERTLTNGLSFAGLTPGATFEDVLTGATVTASGDSISVTVPARGSVVLVRR